MKGRKRASEHDWFIGVSTSGLVLSEPVLEERFPGGFPPAGANAQHWFRRKHDAYRLALDEHERLSARGKDARAARGRVRSFIDRVLEEDLRLPAERWAKSDRIPDALRVPLPTFHQVLAPSRVLLDSAGGPALPVLIVDPDQDLDRLDKGTGTWKVTPTIRLERLLRERNLRVGLVTNGEAWRLLHCPPGAATGWLEWSSAVLAEEPRALASFTRLLAPELLLPEEGTDSLAELCAKSLSRQAQVADQLGVQVIEGIELLLEELDRLDRESGGALLAELDEDELYQLLVVVLMRLVFLLYAEENRLVPHGELLYDQAYGVTYLWRELVVRGEDSADGIDAWRRLLATARLVHLGCDHPDLLSRAYGGLLFDAARPVVRALEDERARVRNSVVQAVLEKLLFARAGRGTQRQRVGYWSLDVEELGYLYEGLLDRGVQRAGSEPLVRLPGEVVARPVAELEALEGEARLTFVLEARGKKGKRDRDRLAARVEEGISDEDCGRLRLRHSAAVAARLEPLGPLLDCARCVEPGHRYLAPASTRRASGAHYTPQFLTDQVVRATLEPLVYRCKPGRPGDYESIEGERVVKAPAELLALKVADIAMGSGAFLVQVVRYLADRLVDAWREAAREHEGRRLAWPHAEPDADPEALALPFEDADELRLLARRAVAQRCVYGVDVNPYAVEMAKLSLWIVTLARDHPFTFLDHALKCGDSLVGASRQQLERMSLQKGGAIQHPPGLEDVGKLLADATRARESIRSRPVLEAADTRRMAELLASAERDVERVRLVGDLLCGAYLAETTKSARETLVAGHMTLLEQALRSKDFTELESRARESLGETRPFHWFAEFPEVFEQGGFDAIVGNPPFLGGLHLSGTFGHEYREYLVDVIGSGKRGLADYVSYFVLRAAELLEPAGFTGLLATNTIAQGDTRENGLDQLFAAGWTVYDADKSRPWPGKASNEYARIHLTHSGWSGERRLDGALASFPISPSLDAGPMGAPHGLAANDGKSFIGCYVLGLGFTMSPEDAQEWIRRDPRNAEVLKPYLGGEDLNSRPDQSPPRWVIDFQDWPLEKAERWPELLNIVRAKVKPQRDNDNRKVYRDRWWQFAERRPALRRAILGLERMICRARVSDYNMWFLVPTGLVPNEKTVVVASQDGRMLGLLQSAIHEAWLLQWRTTMKADTCYTPSECFETFPFPAGAVESHGLERASELFLHARAACLAERRIGLTNLWNLLHRESPEDADLRALRAAIVALDEAVLAAYGWSGEVDLEHGEHERIKLVTKDGVEQTKRIPRFGISDRAARELVRRLFDLNAARHRAETSVAPTLFD